MGQHQFSDTPRPHIHLQLVGLDGCTVSWSLNGSPPMEPGRPLSPSPALRLFVPGEDDSAHRIKNPVRTTQSEQEAACAAVAAAHADPVQPLHPAEAESVRNSCSLSVFYDRYMGDWRRQQVRSGELAKGTLDKERQALRRWSAWERQQQPDDWPAGTEWSGLPLAYVTRTYLQRFVDSLRESLAAQTVRTTWYQLRTIVNFAVKIGVLAHPPQAPRLPEQDDDADLDADICATTFTLDELDRLCRALDSQPDLQAALVLAANAGARPVDLFQLRWGHNVRIDQAEPEIWYRARKTKKRHWMPLAPLTAEWLRRHRGKRLLEAETLVFPRLTSGRSKDPERSRAARARNAAIKAAMESLGIPTTGDFERPWQILRATCNTRLNAVSPGIGRFLLHGPPADPNSESYFNYVDLAKSAVNAMAHPPAFTDLLK